MRVGLRSMVSSGIGAAPTAAKTSNVPKSITSLFNRILLCESPCELVQVDYC